MTRFCRTMASCSEAWVGIPFLFLRLMWSQRVSFGCISHLTYPLLFPRRGILCSFDGGLTMWFPLGCDPVLESREEGREEGREGGRRSLGEMTRLGGKGRLFILGCGIYTPSFFRVRSP